MSVSTPEPSAPVLTRVLSVSFPEPDTKELPKRFGQAGIHDQDQEFTILSKISSIFIHKNVAEYKSKGS